MEKAYYTINEVCEILELKPHIIRYWETEFTKLKSKKKRYPTRYSPDEIELLRRVKYLIYERKFTLIGAKEEIKRENEEKKSLSKNVPKEKRNVDSIVDIKNELIEIRGLLSGKIEGGRLKVEG